MSKPWGGMGSWAEQAEAEEREAAAVESAAPSFPSLKEAVSAKPRKKKMSLNEFYSTSGGGGGGFKGDGMLRLPTGPKDRSPEEMRYGRFGNGGGFSDYGRATGPPPLALIRDGSDGSWGGGRRQYGGGGGGFDEERRGPPPRVSDYDHQPSRADEADNWVTAKKPLASFDSGRSQGRYSSLGGGSRADEVDNWAIGKKPFPARSSNFGSGFRDSGPEPDPWTRGGNHETERERPRLVLDRQNVDVRTNESMKTNRQNPFGAARPREEVLADKGLDWKKLEMEMEAKKASAVSSSRPTSAHSSRPSSAHSSKSEGPPGVQQGLENVVSKTRLKANPFGDAKLREVLLQERGQDWRQMDLELEHLSIDRPETMEEKLLKEEIGQLKEKLRKAFVSQANKESQEFSGGDNPTLQDIIFHKERELEMLVRDFDDIVKFGQKAVERPGSGAGRSASFPERPPSQAGSSDGSKSMEFIDRSRSRGPQDIWTRPGGERRGFQGGRERGFLGSRDFNRPRSRERW